MICRACRDWKLAPRDAFCPGCGAFAFAVTLETQVGGDGSSFPVIVLDRPADPALDGVTLAVARGPVSAAALSADPFDDLTLGDFAGETSFPLLDVAADDQSAAVLGVHVVSGVDASRRLVDPAVARRAPGVTAAALTVLTDTLTADAVRPASDRPSDGGWLMAHIANPGEAVALHGAVLRLDRRRKSAAPTLWLEPRVLLTGATATVPVFVDAETAAILASLCGEVSGSVQFLGPAGQGVCADRAVRIARLGPLAATLAVRPRLAALAGRTLRLPVTLTNTGGQVLRLVSAALLTRPAADAPVERTALQMTAADLRPGLSGAWELHCPAPAAKVAAAALQVVVAGQDGATRTLTAEFALDVRPAGTTFKGRLCVDFGTTASAVAAVPGRSPSLSDDAVLATPFMVDLERVGVGGPGEGERFLASEAALTRDGAMVFGTEIDALPAHEVLTRFAGFKWMLAEEAGFDVAVAYLLRLKDLIETHPDVAGLIGPSTPVFATCPTRFAPGLRMRLVQAFCAAGFPDPRTGLFDRRGEAVVLIAESWAPLPYALFADPARLKGLGADPAVIRPTLTLKEGQTGRAVVIDVGGGSADNSVISIGLHKGRYRIAETYRRTDRGFVGDVFSAQIAKSLAALQRQGLLPPGNVDTDRLVQAVQHADGAFGGAAMRDVLTAHFAARLAGEDGQRDEAAIRSALGAEARAGATGETLGAGFERRTPLPLGSEGDPDGLTLNEEGLIDLCSRVLADFTREHLEPVVALVREAVGEIAPDEPLLLIPSGRGVAFPLAQSLVVQAWRLCAGAAPLCILRPLEAKSITSWGGLVLADLAAAGANFDIDLNDDFHVLAVAGRELQTDRIRLQSLPWLANGGAKVAGARLSDLDEGALHHDGIVVRFGDPQGDETDLLGTAYLPKEAAAEPEAHWLVAELGRAPAVVKAGDAADAVKRAKRVKR